MPYNATQSYTVTISLALTPTTLPSGTTNSSYSQQMSASGGTTPYTYAVTGSTDGLTLSSAGLLSGTPASLGSYNLTITATDAHGVTGSQTYTLSVTPGNPVSAQWNNATYVTGNNTSISISPPGSTSVAVGDSIIGALAMSTNGVISSITDSGNNTYSIDVNVANGTNVRTVIFSTRSVGVGHTFSSAGNITVHFSTAPTLAALYAFDFAGLAAIAVDKTGNATGNSTSPNSGSVTPTMADELIFGAIGYRNSNGNITVSTYGSGYVGGYSESAGGAAPFPVIAPEYVILSNANLNGQSASETLSASATWAGAIAAYKAVPTVTSVSPTLGPTAGGNSVTITGTNFASGSTASFGNTTANATVNSATQITATAPAQASAATVDVTVTSSNSTSATYTGDQYTYYVPLTISPTTLPAATVGVSYSQTITAANGSLPYTYTVTSGTLPAGLSLSSGGSLSGTPATAGTGNLTITATDANSITGNQTYTFTVNKASSVTTIATPSSPSTFGISVTFTATVTGTGGTPTGTLTFTDGGVSMGTAALIGGTASFTTTATALPAGTDTITAVYAGDANFLTGTSSPVVQTVAQAGLTTTVTNPSNPSVFGQTVTFTATVTSSTLGTPTGIVTFSDGGTSIGTSSLASGKATLPVAYAGLGTHTITATYAGDTNFTASPVSGNFSQVVNQAELDHDGHRYSNLDGVRPDGDLDRNGDRNQSGIGHADRRHRDLP